MGASKDVEKDEKELLTKGKFVEPLKEVKNFDHFLRLGPYCYFILFVAELMTLTSLTSMIFMSYAGIPPKVVACGNYSITINDTASCDAFKELQQETGCIPKLDKQFDSVNVEFKLYCGDDSKQVKTSTSIQMIGVLIGAIFAGYLSDSFGRRLTLIISLFGMTGFTFASGFAPDLFWFTTMRTIVGLFTGGLSAVQGVYVIENIPKKHRLWINTVITWSPNFIIFPPMVYLCGDWRMLSHLSAFCSLAAGIGMCVVFESPRWLIYHGHIHKAREIMGKINRIDGKANNVQKELELEAMLVHEQEMYDAQEKKGKKYTFYHLICTWKYLVWTATISYGIITTSLVNYGIMFNMEKLSGSLYWNNVIFGIFRWAANITVGVIDYNCHRVGRKTINSYSSFWNFSSLVLLVALYTTGYQKEYSTLATIATMGVAAMTSQLYLAKFMITSEIFPTPIRNLAVAALSISSRLAGIVSPQLFYLSEIYIALPYIVLLAFTTVDWIAFQVLLPETKGQNLQNDLPPKTERIFYRRQSIVEA